MLVLKKRSEIHSRFSQARGAKLLEARFARKVQEVWKVTGGFVF
jgi:hypothetical protein